MPQPKQPTNAYKRRSNELPHFALAMLFVVTQFAFIAALRNRSYTLVASVITVTIGSIFNVYTNAKRNGALPKLKGIAWPALAQSVPLNIILYVVAYYKGSIDRILRQGTFLHSGTSMATTAGLYAGVSVALVLSAWIHTGLPAWIVNSIESAAFLTLIGHIVLSTSDTEGVVDVLSITAAALATFSIRLYWSQSFEVFHKPGSHGKFEGPVDTTQ